MSKLQDTPQNSNDGNESDNPLNFLRNIPKKWAGIGIAVIFGVLFFVLINYNYIAGVHNQGVKLQNDLMAEYGNTQIELGNCLDKSRQAAGVATALTQAQRDILEKAVTGRYVDAKGNSTTASGAAGRGAYFSAIQEAYPDLSQVSKAFQDVMIIVTGCRDSYNGAQKKLQVVIADFATWQQQRTVFNAAGKSRFPNDNLVASLPGYDETSDLTGRAALRRMKAVIVTKEAGGAYRSGSIPDQDLFGNGDK